MVQFYHKLSKNSPSILLDTLWKNSWWVAQPCSGHILINFLKETPGYFQKVPHGHMTDFFWMYSQSTHWSHCDQIDGYFVKELSIWSLATVWVNCLKNHNVITMYLLGKTPPAPSVRSSSMQMMLEYRDWRNPVLLLVQEPSSYPYIVAVNNVRISDRDRNTKY